MLEQRTEARPRETDGRPALSVRSASHELYRVLPALAIGVAGLTVVITLGQVLFGRGPVPQAGPTVTSVAPAIAQARVASAVTVPTDTPLPLPPAANPTAPAAKPTLAPSATAPPPTATPLPPATLDLSFVYSGVVRAQGRVLKPSAKAYYWFLIREPGRDGFFRQGPANVDQQGDFTFNLDLRPLRVGADSVTLAAIPTDLSAAWMAESQRTGTWLPVVDVKPENGIALLREVGLTTP